MRALFAVTLACAFAASVAACKREPDAYERARAHEAEEQRRKDAAVKQYGAMVNAKIARVHEVADLVKEVPVAADDAVAPKTSPPMKLRPLHLDDEDTNADLNLQAELAFLQRGILGTCAFYLRGIPSDVEASIVEDVLRGCTRMRFFMVVRPWDKIDAKLLDSGDEYVGGEVDGDVVVYDLDAEGPPLLLGAFPLHVALSKSVEVRFDSTKKERQYDLDEALREEVERGVEKKLAP